MQEREGVVEASGSRRKLDRAGCDLIEQLAALNGSEWSVAGILDEVLPEQRNLWEARCLLKPALYENNTTDSKKHMVASFNGGRLKRSGFVKPIRAASDRASITPALPSGASKQSLVPINADRHTSLRTPDHSFRGHVLTLWEDKFRRKCLAVEDMVFLLARPNVAYTLESASFLRATQMSYDQVVELEMALIMLREQEGWPRSNCPQATTLSLCDKLARNAWIYGRALAIPRTGSVTLPEVIPSKRLSAVRPKPVGKRYEEPITPTQGSFQCRILSKAAASKHPAAAVINGCPRNIRDWVRDHCMEEVVRSTSMRKQFAAEKLSILLTRHCHRAIHRRYMHWRQQTMWTQCHLRVRKFCRLKSALWVLQRSRKKLGSVVFRLWTKWMASTSHQREYEAIAAAVSIQSWLRGVKGKRIASVHHLHQAATLIQARWRGFLSRKRFKRRKRFLAYNRAARQVQRYYHSYISRVRCDIWLRQQRAARMITRAFVRYLEKKRDLIAWCHHLARYHAAISIQIWMRRTRRRIVRAKAKRDTMAQASHVLFNFFRYTQFMRRFGARVETLAKRQRAAAVLLQNAYRAKQARARFYELKVRVEDQRRQEILTHMWNNASKSGGGNCSDVDVEVEDRVMVTSIVLKRNVQSRLRI
ncbi:hypothetical protein PR002_g1059 [Phytophthora rubi]|uniref:Uncharacterized protein n=2 Tax=Phytophthora rubi TaxID=129364 RepID=A0A6A3P494_9STRA|nr:hypothetical protein PR002_g1059 [Phytophthora rubi]